MFFQQDLKEQLWEMSDERKLEAEAERQSVINEGWLEDRLGLLTNHYLTLLQVSSRKGLNMCAINLLNAEFSHSHIGLTQEPTGYRRQWFYFSWGP